MGQSHSATAVLGLGLLVVACLTVSAEAATISFGPSSPSLTNVYDWKLSKTIGGGSGGGGASSAISVSRGSNIDLAFTINAERVLVSSTATLTFTATCAQGSTSVSVTTSGGAALGSAAIPTGATTASFPAVPLPVSAGGAGADSIVVTCSPGGALDQVTTPITFTTANTVEVRGTATLSDVITWPTWSQFFPSGGWLTTTPTTAVTAGSYPSSGTTLRGSTTLSYTWTLSNTLLCFSGAAVSNTATLQAGTGGDARTYAATASASISVVNCDVQPAITVSAPNVQTALTYAWSQQVTPVTSASLQVPWGTGGTVQALATFTRTVTSATLTVSFNLQITNPAAAPIAVNNLQLSCPWGGNVLLPCGSLAGGVMGTGFTGATGTWLVIPASGSISCMVNNLQMQGMWGSDFSQPCTIMTSNWLGTQTTLTGLVLNFAAPTRLISINNCAQWSVQCTAATGNALWAPTVGGMPVGQQVCGSDTTNAPLPAQTFSISLGGGWIGDGTQPGACASAVSVNCQSNLQLQSTAGTTQAFGGTQSAALTISAVPIQCPLPPSPTPAPSPSPAPSSTLLLKSVDPVITPLITRTSIRGALAWSVSSSITPLSQAVSLQDAGAAGVTVQYRVTATPGPASAGDTVSYLLEGGMRVANPDAFASLRVDEVDAVVDGTPVPLACSPPLPASLPPGASLACAVAVNYNGAGAANTLFGRAVVTSDAGVRRTVDSGSGVRFSWEGADVSQARGACARVHQSYATNSFDLVQVTGVAPSFDAAEPTTVCGATTWVFDVRITPRSGAPCGAQQVVQTVTADWEGRAGSQTQQGSSTATLLVTGAGCPALAISTQQRASGDIVDERSGGMAAPAPSPSLIAAAPPQASSSPARPVAAPAGLRDRRRASAAARSNTDTVTQQPARRNGSLAVVVSGVQARKAAQPAWQLTVTPEGGGANVTLPQGAPGTVAFRVAWQHAKPLAEFTGSVTVTNNGAAAAVVDGVLVKLLAAPGTSSPAAVLASTNADCRAPQGPDSSSAPSELPPGAELRCSFSVRAASSGVLTATVTRAGSGGAAVSSKPVPATVAGSALALASNGDCARLRTGVAASELGAAGMLRAKGAAATHDEEVCQPGSTVVTFDVGRDAAGGFTKCRIPVVAIASLQPSGATAQQAVVATGAVDALVAGCSGGSGGSAAATAAVASVRLARRRSPSWVVSIATEPDTANDTWFAADSGVQVVSTWRQEPGPEQLAATGEVMVKGVPGITKVKVVGIPLCAPTDQNCAPLEAEAACKEAADNPAAARCRYELQPLPLTSGLLLAFADGAQAGPALAYNPARARGSGRPTPLCARLSEDLTLKAAPGQGGAALPKLSMQGAAPLGVEPFCGQSKSSNTTLSFEVLSPLPEGAAGTDESCDRVFVFHGVAAATPVLPGAKPVQAEVTFNVSAVC